MRGVGDDQPEDDVNPEGEPGEEDQQQQGEADARDFESEEFGQPGNYVMGGNIAGFRKVADSMIEQGVM